MTRSFTTRIMLLLFLYGINGEHDEDPAKFNEWLHSQNLANPVEVSEVRAAIHTYVVVFTLFSPKCREGKIISIETSFEELETIYLREAPCKCVTHGWLSNDKSPSVSAIKDAYMETISANIITVNWRVRAENYNYMTSATDTFDVGGIVADLLEHLIEGKFTEPSRIHIIGHSLGSHVAASAGHNIIQITNEKVSRITGLDPAKPGFELVPLRYVDSEIVMLNKSLAQFLDVIHTCDNILGIYEGIGHADFYPNGGSHTQPGCSSFSACSHGRAYDYFVQSILLMNSTKSHFVSTRCDSYSDFLNGACDSNPKNVMGEAVDQSITGSFQLMTTNDPPYAIEEGDNSLGSSSYSSWFR
ncbi:pancreatic triacylglycerol lipase isoform X2 [Nilaparvata lugens]|uniref:pancreatic triacylglycerol lipase isoform X2 n=1 Tax=Nilaparvata lugens TaxID=108931 RepID=UPI00193E530A|nr:pancreatic triacylglycerol lipase isoform X2 [Nilaparvata lugens]